MTTNQPERLWWVLHTRSRFENVVDERLRKKRLEVFTPKIRVKSKRKDRNLMIHQPLFPGYVFVKSDLQPIEHLEILKTLGAVQIIGTSHGPVPVPEDHIESLRIMVSTDMPIITGTRFRKGNRIIVINGPFAGVTGVFLRYQGKGRVMVYIQALGRFAAVEVEESDIEILPEILS